MFFKKIENNQAVGNLITEENLKAVLDTINFDLVNGNPLFFESKGYAVIVLDEKPSITALQTLKEDTAIRQIDGTWKQSWIVIDLPTSDQIEIYNAKLEQVKYIQSHKIQTVDDFIAGPEYKDVIDHLTSYKTALENVDLSDPFNVKWPDCPPAETGIALPY